MDNQMRTELLKKINLGKSVAEQDEALIDNFIETTAFTEFINGKYNIIIGNKGTGKTSIYRKLLGEKDDLKQKGVVVYPAFSSRGRTDFSAIAGADPLNENDYQNIWKLYFFTLLSAKALSGEFGNISNEDRVKVRGNLEALGVDSYVKDPESRNSFSKLIRKIMERTRSVGFTAEAEGEIPGIKGSFSIGLNSGQEENATSEGEANVNVDDEIHDINVLLDENKRECWLVMDRLDEAFQGKGEIERLALRALLRVYLDFMEFSNIKLKLLMRRDLFERVTSHNFVNLTHINSGKKILEWESEDLENMLCTRLRKSFDSDLFPRGTVSEGFSISESTNDQVLEFLFPEKVELRERQSKSWKWVNDRTRDGSSGSPRNLIDYVTYAVENQLRILHRDILEGVESRALIDGQVMKSSVTQLSAERVRDTLLAEAGDFRPDIEKFRGGKAEQDDHSLKHKFGERFREVLDYLNSVGFFDSYGDSYKVVFLFRDGLQITQGKDPDIRRR